MSGRAVSGNQGIVEALLKIERAAYPELVTIGEMRSGKDGEVYHIRGWATSGTSQPGNSFSNTIYLQDDTGGVALVPFTEDKHRGRHAYRGSRAEENPRRQRGAEDYRLR